MNKKIEKLDFLNFFQRKNQKCTSVEKRMFPADAYSVSRFFVQYNKRTRMFWDIF